MTIEDFLVSRRRERTYNPECDEHFAEENPQMNPEEKAQEFPEKPSEDICRCGHAKSDHRWGSMHDGDCRLCDCEDFYVPEEGEK